MASFVVKLSDIQCFHETDNYCNVDRTGFSGCPLPEGTLCQELQPQRRIREQPSQFLLGLSKES